MYPPRGDYIKFMHLQTFAKQKSGNNQTIKNRIQVDIRYII